MANREPGSEYESSSSERVSDGPHDFLLAQALAQTATKAECLFAWFRVFFCTSALVVFLLSGWKLNEVTTPQVLIELAVAALGIGFSFWILHRARRELLDESMRRTSVAIDATLVLGALATNWFSPFYQGVLASLDIAVVPLVTMTSILRLSRTAVATSAIMMTLCLGILVGVDPKLGLPVAPDKLFLLGLYQAAAVIAAWCTTNWFMDTIRQASSASIRVERARGGLLALLTDHHDVGSAIADARLNAERLREHLSKTSPRGVSTHQLGEKVEASLARVGQLLHGTRDRALRVLEGAADPQPADITLAGETSIRSFKELWPDVNVTARLNRDLPPVLFGGGTIELSRVLSHLMVNSAEGNGTNAATSIVLEVKSVGRGGVLISISDNGPGFPAGLLAHLGKHGFSTKSRSSGLGLWLAHAAVSAVGGSLRLSQSKSGAKVCLTLRSSHR